MRNIILRASTPLLSSSSFSFSNIKTNSPSSKMLKEKREFKSVTEICKREHFKNVPWLNRSTLVVPETPWWNKHGTYHHSIQQWLPDRSCDCTVLKKCQTLGSVRWTCLQSLRLNPNKENISLSAKRKKPKIWVRKNEPRRQTLSICYLGNLPKKVGQKSLLPKLEFAWSSLWLGSCQIGAQHPRVSGKEEYSRNNDLRMFLIQMLRLRVF